MKARRRQASPPLKHKRHNLARIKGGWTEHEDVLLCRLVEQMGEGHWSDIARALNAAMGRKSDAHGRIGKQCRERFNHHLAPGTRKDAWSVEEEALLVKAVKNHWNSTLRRRDMDDPEPRPLKEYIRWLGLRPPAPRKKSGPPKWRRRNDPHSSSSGDEGGLSSSSSSGSDSETEMGVAGGGSGAVAMMGRPSTTNTRTTPTAAGEPVALAARSAAAAMSVPRADDTDDQRKTRLDRGGPAMPPRPHACTKRVAGAGGGMAARLRGISRGAQSTRRVPLRIVNKTPQGRQDDLPGLTPHSTESEAHKGTPYVKQEPCMSPERRQGPLAIADDQHSAAELGAMLEALDTLAFALLDPERHTAEPGDGGAAHVADPPPVLQDQATCAAHVKGPLDSIEGFALSDGAAAPVAATPPAHAGGVGMQYSPPVPKRTLHCPVQGAMLPAHMYMQGAMPPDAATLAERLQASTSPIAAAPASAAMAVKEEPLEDAAGCGGVESMDLFETQDALDSSGALDIFASPALAPLQHLADVALAPEDEDMSGAADVDADVAAGLGGWPPSLSARMASNGSMSSCTSGFAVIAPAAAAASAALWTQVCAPQMDGVTPAWATPASPPTPGNGTLLPPAPTYPARAAPPVPMPSPFARTAGLLEERPWVCPAGAASPHTPPSTVPAGPSSALGATPLMQVSSAGPGRTVLVVAGGQLPTLETLCMMYLPATTTPPGHAGPITHRLGSQGPVRASLPDVHSVLHAAALEPMSAPDLIAANDLLATPCILQDVASAAALLVRRAAASHVLGGVMLAMRLGADAASAEYTVLLAAQGPADANVAAGVAEVAAGLAGLLT